MSVGGHPLVELAQHTLEHPPRDLEHASYQMGIAYGLLWALHRELVAQEATAEDKAEAERMMAKVNDGWLRRTGRIE